jgi:CubicO group peptidase (beta-lactamase class C family)
MDPEWDRLTLDMALTHRLALPGGFLDIDCIDANSFGTDYLAYMLTWPLTGKHGGERCYTDGAYYVLARCAEVRAGMRLAAFLDRELFTPLGYREAAWSCCPMGHAMGATGLYIRTEDMAKLGEVYRTGGMYQGQRLLSEAWVQTVRTRGYELTPKAGGAVGKGGMRGQMLAIFPDRVVAWHACGGVDTDDLLTITAQN